MKRGGFAPSYTEGEKEILRTRYETNEPLRSIIADLCRSRSSVYRMVRVMGLSRPDGIERIGLVRRAPAMTDAILAACGRPGGFHHSQDIGFKKPNVITHVRTLCLQGLAFKAELGWRRSRWFLTQEQADAAMAASPALPARGIGEKARGQGPAYLPGEPVITARTKYTIAPPPPARLYRTSTYEFGGSGITVGSGSWVSP